jgi:hypothetical protein
MEPVRNRLVQAKKTVPYGTGQGQFGPVGAQNQLDRPVLPVPVRFL